MQKHGTSRMVILPLREPLWSQKPRGAFWYKIVATTAVAAAIFERTFLKSTWKLQLTWPLQPPQTKGNVIIVLKITWTQSDLKSYHFTHSTHMHG
jgi:hypothetical protein